MPDSSVSDLTPTAVMGDVRAAERIELAHSSLSGPWTEVGVGVGMVLVTPLLGVLVALGAGPGLFPCGFLSDDPDCDARARKEQRRANLIATAIAVPFGLGGIAAIAHGAYKVRRIRASRQHLDGSASVGPGRATLTLRLTF